MGRREEKDGLARLGPKRAITPRWARLDAAFPRRKETQSSTTGSHRPPPAAGRRRFALQRARCTPAISAPPFARRTARLEWTGPGTVDCSGACCLCSNKGREGAAAGTWQSSGRGCSEHRRKSQVMERCSFSVYPSIADFSTYLDAF